jgi:hypothetical protein
MKTKTMGIALLSAAALLGGTAAQADLPWTYGELGYVSLDGSENSETDGFELKASVGFASKWHAQLSYLDGETDGQFFSGVDFDGFRVVVGAHPQLTPNTQLVADLTYFDYGFENNGPESDGYGVGLGLRHALSDKFEVIGEVWVVDGAEGSGSGPDTDFNDATVEVGGRYNWMPSLSTGLTLSLNGYPGLRQGVSGGDVVRFDVRWSFGDLL